MKPVSMFSGAVPVTRILAPSTTMATALKTFSLANSISEISAQDAIFKFDAAENRKINQEAPWTKE